MRLVIDMQGAQTASRSRGIGRYTTSFAKEVIKQCGSHNVHLILNGMLPETAAAVRDDFHGLLDKDCISAWYGAPPVRWALTPSDSVRRKSASDLRTYAIAALNADIAHVTSLFEGFGDDAMCTPLPHGTARAQTVTFYDAIPKLYPSDYLSDPLYASFYEAHGTVLNCFDHFLAISETVRGEAINCFGVPGTSITNVGAGVDELFQPTEVDRERQLLPLGIDKPFILYTGGFDKRKNLPRLIEAFGLIPTDLRRRHQLVIVGDCHASLKTELRLIAAANGLAENALLMPGYVADPLLCSLYSACALSILPSWHEGFGLPVLEAMLCGAVVLGARTSAIKELLTDNNALFDPFSTADMASAITRYLVSEDLRRDNRAYGLRKAQEYSWRATACKAWDVWEATIKSAHAAPRTAVRHDTFPVESLASELSAQRNLTDSDLAEIATAIARTESSRPGMTPRHLFVDISELSQRDARTGVQRVTRSILGQLLQYPPYGFVVSPVYAVATKPGYRHATAFTRRLFGVGEPSLDDQLIEPAGGDYFLGLDLQHHVVLSQRSWLQWAYAHGVNIYFVIYDLLPIQFPDCFPPGTEAGHLAWLHVVTSFDGVACISRTVAHEVSDWLRSAPRARTALPRVAWFHLGSDINNSAPTTGVPSDITALLQTWQGDPTFLMVGTVEPRKGHSDAIDALDILWRQGVAANLVIIGKPGWHTDSLAARIKGHPQYGTRLYWLYDASDELLQLAYSAATALLALSRGEGFGLPIIEAAEHAVPIIARDIPIFREVGGVHASYVAFTSPDTLAQAIRDWLHSQRNGDIPRPDGLPRLTWAECTSQLLDAVAISARAATPPICAHTP